MATVAATCEACGEENNYFKPDDHSGSVYAWECRACEHKHLIPATATIDQIEAAAGVSHAPVPADVTLVEDGDEGGSSDSHGPAPAPAPETAV